MWFFRSVHYLPVSKVVLSVFFSLHQDVTHGFDVFVFDIFRTHKSNVSTRQGWSHQNSLPNPILESQVVQSFCSLPMIPILALEYKLSLHSALNPSLLQPICNDASGPISVFHELRPSEVARYCPSAITELTCLLITVNLICWPILMPMQIFEKDVFQ